MGLGIDRKLHWFIDVLIGVVSGQYRKGNYPSRPAKNIITSRNENDHHVDYSEKEIVDRIQLFSGKSSGGNSYFYPALFWLKKFLDDGQDQLKICDWGGSYGFEYFKFTQYLGHELNYTVVEIPEVVSRAIKIHKLKQIKFIADNRFVDFDIFYSKGVMADMDRQIFNFLENSKPRYLILQSVECSEQPTFYSIQTLRRTGRRCVYKTYNLKEFVGKVERLGYELLDSWLEAVQGSGVFLRGPSVQAYYHGFAFRRII